MPQLAFSHSRMLLFAPAGVFHTRRGAVGATAPLVTAVPLRPSMARSVEAVGGERRRSVSGDLSRGQGARGVDVCGCGVLRAGSGQAAECAGAERGRRMTTRRAQRENHRWPARSESGGRIAYTFWLKCPLHLV